MLTYSEIENGKTIILDGEPYEVIDSNVFRKQQRKPVNQTKLRHLPTGKVMERSFHHSDKVEEADIIEDEREFVYCRRGECILRDPKNPKDRFSVPEEVFGDKLPYITEGMRITTRTFDGTIISAQPPIKVDLAVTEAAPGVKGDTAQGGTKAVTLESGTSVSVPLFINQGDVVRVNTQTGAYVERAEKSSP